MKSIVYILLVAILCSIVVSALPKTISYQKQIVTIRAVDKSPDTNLLVVSCSIIKNRLKDYGLQNFDVSADATQKSIYITFTDKVDLNEILPLILSKGKIEFYETHDRSEVSKLLKKDDKLNSLLNLASENPETDHSSAIFGYCKEQIKADVDSILSTRSVGTPGQGIKYVWSGHKNKDGNYYLYLLKHQAAMDKSQILETALVKQPNETDKYDVMINFNKNGTLIWQGLSKRNIGKEIAIVIDNMVYSAPTVMGEINNGKCVISGNFSIKEITCLKSLISNDQLPLEFKLKE